MAATLANIQGLLKQVYSDAIVEQLENNNVLYKIFEKDVTTKNLQGKDIIVPVHTGRNAGIGARAEGGTLPTGRNQTHVQITVPLKYLYGRVDLTGQSMLLARKDISAFMDAKTNEMEGIVTDVTRDFNRQLHSDGTGIIAQANGAGVGTATLVLDNQKVGATVAQYLQGAYIDIITSGGSTEVSGIQVLAVVSNTATAATVTLASTQTWSDDSYVYITGNRNNEVVGMLGAVDDGGILATYMGVNRTTAGNQYWQSSDFNNTGTPRNATEALFDQGFQACIQNGQTPTHAGTAFSPFKTLGAALVAQKRFINLEDSNLRDLPGGYMGFSVNGIKVFADVDCQKSNLYIFNADNFTLYQPAGAEFIDFGSGTPWFQTANQDAATAALRWYVALFCNRPNVQAVVRDLQ